MSTNLFLALLPTVVIVVYIMKFDRYNPEPIGLLVKLFLAGCVSVIPAIILERMVPENYYSYTTLFIYCLTGVALIEEGVKYFFVRLLGYRHEAFDEIYDGIIYCVMVSLGFATVENVLYVFSYGTAVAITRMLTAVPAHAIFATSMGYYMGKAKAYPQTRMLNTILSVAVPVLLHGIYDFVLFIDQPWVMLVFVVYLIYLYKKAFALIRETYNQYPFR